MNFQKSMEFTNMVHKTVAIPKIYEANGMGDVISEVGTMADLRDGIDYTIREKDGTFTVQERFRQSRYKFYRDITFRYDRPSDPYDTRREFFKIKADAFLYGIVNDECDDFEWAYMFEVEPVVEAIKNGTMPNTYLRNKDDADTGFIAVNVVDIDKIGATILKYNL